MGLPLIAAMGIAAGASILGGISSSNTTKANARNAYTANAANAMYAQSTANLNANMLQAASSMNAAAIMGAGRATASLIGAVGEQNAMLEMASAWANVESRNRVTEYNVMLAQQVGAYNVSLLESELPGLLNEYGLNVMRLEQESARQEGAVIAHQAASGTVIGEGSNADVIIDHRSQAALDAFILRYNFDKQGRDINNAIARSQWETAASVQQMMWEGQVNEWNTLTQSMLNAQAIRNQSRLDAGVTMINSVAGAASTLIGGMADAYSTRSAGTASYLTSMSTANAAYNSGMNTAGQQVTSSILNGIGNAATIYGASYIGKAGTTQSLLPTSQVAPGAISYRPVYQTPSIGQDGGSLLA